MKKIINKKEVNKAISTIKASFFEKEKKSKETFSEEIKLIKNENDIINSENYFIRNLRENKKFQKADFNKKIQIIKKEKKKYFEEEKTKFLEEIKKVKNAPEFFCGYVYILWKKSRTWGMNPHAEAKIYSTDIDIHEYYTNSASGCGYDKESTVIAGVLNQSYTIKKVLLKLININSDIYGYSGNYSKCIPYLSGGVGTSCFESLFKQIGIKMEREMNTNNIDIFKLEIIKKENKQ